MKRGTARTPNPSLRAAREAAGLTQQELADLVGVTRGTIANAENGASTPRGMVVDRLAAALGTTPDRLGLPAANEHPLARVRRAAGVTQEQLARQCGVTRRTIIDLEAGRGSPKPVLLAKLVERFGLGPAELGFAPANAHPLAAARAAHGLTQRQLAEYVGVHPNVIIKAEAGKRPPRPGTVLNLADFFQATPGALGFPEPGDSWRVAERRRRMRYWVPVGELLVRVPPPGALPQVRELPPLPRHLAGRGEQSAYLHAALAGFPHGVRAGARDAARAAAPWLAARVPEGTAPIVRPDPARAPGPGDRGAAAAAGRGVAGVDAAGDAAASDGAAATPEKWLRPLPGAAAVAESTEAVRRRTFPRTPPGPPSAGTGAGSSVASSVASSAGTSGGRGEGAPSTSEAVFRDRFALAVQSGYLRGWTLVMAQRALRAAARQPKLAADGVDAASCRAAAESLVDELPRTDRPVRRPGPGPRTHMTRQAPSVAHRRRAPGLGRSRGMRLG